MTRFAADTPDERRSLFADGIAAHRERGSPFVTFEAEPPDVDGGGDGNGDDDSADAGDSSIPWIQYADDESLLNLDCTDEERAAIDGVVDAFGGASVADRTLPAEADGINLRIRVRGDDERVAMLVESLFLEGFGLSETCRVWVTEL